MENKTYYGEYTLKHWIDLILKKNIILPDYQRSFVWTKEKIKFFINSIKNNEFIPPVTIGNYRNGQNEKLIGKNLILDGQQRLTSILLAYFKCFPPENTENTEKKFADEDTENNDETTSFKYWTFKEITKSKNEDEIKKEIENYEAFDLKLDDEFFETHFLGFSYIVPNNNSSDKLFTKIFKNINYQGVSLTPLESRRSLYYTNPRDVNFFEGKTKDGKDVLCGLKLDENNKPAPIDFVRYLATLSQYSKNNKKENTVMYRYARYKDREEYYANFVSHMVEAEEIEDFNGVNFETTFKDWEAKYANLMQTIQEIKPKIFSDSKDTKFKSWIDMDYWLFGLLYWVIFENKKFENANFDNLIKEIKNKIEEIKQDESYKKTPNALWKIRERLVQSIEIYESYTNGQA